MSASSLTDEQRRRIEENRRLALERRAAAVKRQATSSSSPAPLNSSTASASNGPFRDKKKEDRTFHATEKASVPGKTSGSNWNVVTEVLTGTCSLISPNRFVVCVGYSAKLIEIFKNIPGKEYDPMKKKWSFPLDQYDTFKSLTAPLSPGVTIGSIPKTVIKLLTKKQKVDYKQIDLSGIEQDLVDRLFPFQREGVQFGISKEGKCLIADEMGLGKTIQAIAISDYYRSDFPLLIICPSSMRFQWEAELIRNLRGVSSNSIVVVTSGKSLIEDSRVVIISYDLVSRLKVKLQSYRFGIIICDESHKMKTYQSQRSKAILELTQTVKRVILLTGTPALSRPVELYPQIKAIQPNLFPQLTPFGIRYCDGKLHDRFGWNFTGSSHLEELKVILEENMMIRRLKIDVLDQLPEKIRQVIHLSNELIEKDNKTMKQFEKKMDSFNEGNGKDKRSTLLSYFAESGKAKKKAVLAYIEELLERGTKLLCFAHHREVLDAICELLEKKETFYIRIDGSVSSEDRKSVCDQFQTEDKYRVAVLSITASSTGITLTAAQLVVFCELYWNPGELIQAEDRAHRIGQKSSVLVQYLIARGTVDDHLWPLIQSKLNVLNRAGLSKETNLNVASAHGQKHATHHKVKDSTQSTILNFFEEINDGFDHEELDKIMSDIESNTPAKKPRMN